MSPLRLLPVALLGSLTLSPAAFAQDKPLNSSIQIGYLSTIDLTTRNDQMGRFGVSFTRTLRELRKDENNTTSLYLSAEFSSRGDYFYAPILADLKLSTPGNVYYLAGAGVGFGKRPDGAGSTETLTQLAWQAGVGYDFTIGSLPSLFEIRYVSGQRATWSTIGFYYGVRF